MGARPRTIPAQRVHHRELSAPRYLPLNLAHARYSHTLTHVPAHHDVIVEFADAPSSLQPTASSEARGLGCVAVLEPRAQFPFFIRGFATPQCPTSSFSIFLNGCGSPPHQNSFSWSPRAPQKVLTRDIFRARKIFWRPLRSSPKCFDLAHRPSFFSVFLSFQSL